MKKRNTLITCVSIIATMIVMPLHIQAEESTPGQNISANSKAKDRNPKPDLIRNAIEQKPPAIDITTGSEIPSEGYCDQPYVVKLSDGTWLCVMTTGKGHEGQRGQHCLLSQLRPGTNLGTACRHRACKWSRSLLGHALPDGLRPCLCVLHL